LLKATKPRVASPFGGPSKILVALISIALVLAVLELVLRSRGAGIELGRQVQFHPALGWVLKAGLDDFRRGSSSGYRDFEIRGNSLGFRELERPLKKPAGIRRVVLLGDSFTTAVQVHRDDTFGSILESLLEAATGEPWEAINLGVNGYGTAQELLALERYGLAYDPDIVLLQIYPYNDICNNSIGSIGYCGIGNNDYRPYFTLKPEGLRLTWVQPVRSFIRRQLLSFVWFEKVFRGLYVRSRVSLGEQAVERQYRKVRQRERWDRIHETYGITFDPTWYTFARDEDQIESVREGWAVTEELVAEMAARLQEREIAFYGLVIPMDTRVSPDRWNEFISRELESRGGPRLQRDYAEARLRRLFIGLGRPLIEMLPTFELEAEKVLPYWQGHLNPYAHRLTAEAVVEAMRKTEDATQGRP
jgi:lysophospholipase L1-like esterase